MSSKTATNGKPAKGMERLGALAVSEAKKAWGAGWMNLGHALREAAVLSEACLLILSQDLPKYAAAQELIRATLRAHRPTHLPLTERETVEFERENGDDGEEV